MFVYLENRISMCAPSKILRYFFVFLPSFNASSGFITKFRK